MVCKAGPSEMDLLRHYYVGKQLGWWGEDLPNMYKALGFITAHKLGTNSAHL